MTNAFKEIKEKLFGVTGIMQTRQPAEIGVQTLFDKDKHLQTGKISFEDQKLIAAWIGVNELFFSIHFTGKDFKKFNEEMKKIYETNNRIIEKYLLLTKSIDAEGIQAIKTMFGESYIHNQVSNIGIPTEQNKK